MSLKVLTLHYHLIYKCVRMIMERLAYTYIDNQFQRFKLISKRPHHPISGVLVTVLASSLLGCVFDPWSGQTKDYKRQENKDKYYRSETQKK